MVKDGLMRIMTGNVPGRIGSPLIAVVAEAPL
jgi:hypothetical protein